MSLRTCPHCKQRLSAQTMREWGPIASPHCRQLVITQSRCVRYGTTAFWLALCLVALFTARVVGWFAGILVGALVAFVVMLVVIKSLNRIRPRESVLVRLKPARLCPEELSSITECAEKLSVLPAWSERDETDLPGLEHEEFCAGDLQDAVVDDRSASKEAFTSVDAAVPRKKSSQWSLPEMGVEERRTKLQRFASEIRLTETATTQTRDDLREEIGGAHG
jgi:hypothetical protein